MSLSLVKLSDNRFYCFFSKFGFLAFGVVPESLCSCINLEKPEKTASSSVQPIFMSCQPEGFLVSFCPFLHKPSEEVFPPVFQDVTVVQMVRSEENQFPG